MTLGKGRAKKPGAGSPVFGEPPLSRAPGGERSGGERSCGKRRIIGVDPGLASTGWGVIDLDGGRLRHVGHGHIQTKAGLPRSVRLFTIMEEIRAVLDLYKPGEAAMENLYFGKNVSSALPVAEARGVVSATLAERGLAVSEFAPNTIKAGVAGIAKASKEQVQQMVRVILNLEDVPKPNHCADALGVAICAALRAPLAAPLSAGEL